MEKEKEERILPSLVATTSAIAHTTCVGTHYVHTNMKNDLLVELEWESKLESGLSVEKILTVTN